MGFGERGCTISTLRPELLPALRLIVITDRGLAAPRAIEAVVEKALLGGAPAIQLREKETSSGELFEVGQRLRELTGRYGALLFVNDRLDVALAAGADGVHVGPEDISVAALRERVPAGFIIGYSCDDVAEARRAVAAGADYIGCGAVYGTTTKTGAGVAIGLERLNAVATAVAVPVVAIGGITPERAGEVAATRAAGIAVAGAVMTAADPAEAVGRLMEPFQSRAAEP